jgi:hypothetical protein
MQVRTTFFSFYHPTTNQYGPWTCLSLIHIASENAILTLTLRRGIEDALAIEPRRLAARCFSRSRLYVRWGRGSSDCRGTSAPAVPSCLTATRRHCLSSSSVNTTILFTHSSLSYNCTYNTAPYTAHTHAYNRSPLRCEQHWTPTFSVWPQFALLLLPTCRTAQPATPTSLSHKYHAKHSACAWPLQFYLHVVYSENHTKSVSTKYSVIDC